MLAKVVVVVESGQNLLWELFYIFRFPSNQRGTHLESPTIVGGLCVRTRAMDESAPLALQSV